MESPTLQISFKVEAEVKQHALEREISHDVLCDFVDGFAFGDVLGIGVRSVGGFWRIDNVEVLDSPEVSKTPCYLYFLDDIYTFQAVHFR